MTSSTTTPGIFRLLELPAELRVMTYKHTLQASDGISCESVWDPDKCFFRYFPLLFPIRDVLSPGFSRVENPSSQAIVCSTAEVNQLKYVCRQLNTETKGLTLSVNKIVFEEGIAEFINFSRACPPTMVECLRVIAIMSSELRWDRQPASKNTRNAINNLRKFCTQFIQVTVRVRHEHLRPEKYPMLRNALGFKMFLRNKATLFEQRSKIAEDQAIILTEIAPHVSGLEIETFPTNLRVYPPFAKFDDQGFTERTEMRIREMIAEDGDEDAETSGQDSAEVTEMLAKIHEKAAMIKKIFEDGI